MKITNFKQLQKLKQQIKFVLSLNNNVESVREESKNLLDEKELFPQFKYFDQDRFRLMEKLKDLRKQKEYQSAFSKKEPLVSVRVATYNNVEELINRAIPSVINQTYKNWEIVIVGDYCTDDTEEQIKKLNHPKIKFEQLSFHYPYPENQLQRWMAQGALVHNKAVELCKGDWIVPLDDDNEFLPNHIEMLLEKARKDKLELVYGNMISIDRETGETNRVGRFPPQLGTFDFSACLYHKALNIFSYDINSYFLGEVVDTNLIRRFREAEVSMGFVNRYVTKYYFRKPGSARTFKKYPNIPGVFGVYKQLKITEKELPYDLSDLVYDAISNTTGKIVLMGNKNKYFTAFIEAACKKNKKKIILNSSKDKPIQNTDILFINSKESLFYEKIKTYKDFLNNSALVFNSIEINSEKLGNFKNIYEPLDKYTLNKI